MFYFKMAAAVSVLINCNNVELFPLIQGEVVENLRGPCWAT